MLPLTREVGITALDTICQLPRPTTLEFPGTLHLAHRQWAAVLQTGLKLDTASTGHTIEVRLSAYEVILGVHIASNPTRLDAGATVKGVSCTELLRVAQGIAVFNDRVLAPTTEAAVKFLKRIHHATLGNPQYTGQLCGVIPQEACDFLAGPHLGDELRTRIPGKADLGDIDLIRGLFLSGDAGLDRGTISRILNTGFEPDAEHPPERVVPAVLEAVRNLEIALGGSATDRIAVRDGVLGYTCCRGFAPIGLSRTRQSLAAAKRIASSPWRPSIHPTRHASKPSASPTHRVVASQNARHCTARGGACWPSRQPRTLMSSKRSGC